MNKKNRERGNILSLELLAFIIVASIVLPYLLQARLAGRYDDNKALIDEVHILGIAAQNYYSEYSIFPDLTNNCANALNELDNATSSFIAGIDNTSPWGKQYNFSCTDKVFTIITALDNKNAIIVANKLAATTASGATITISVPIPSYIPALDSFLALDASGSFDARNSKIINVADIELATSTGLTASDTLLDLFYKQGKFYTVVPGDEINKPECPSHLVQSIHLSLVGLVASNTKIPYPNPPYIASEDSNAWTVGIDIYTEDGLTAAATGTYALAIINCS